jgi:Holliday junction resolvase RusA-like endonuclease
VIHLIVETKPLPKSRPRFAKGRAYTPKTTVDYEKKIKSVAMATCRRPFEKAVEMRLVFNFVKPKSSKLIHVTKRPDLDNLEKAIMDALNGIAYLDDSQVIRKYSEKKFSFFDHIEITIAEID